MIAHILSGLQTIGVYDWRDGVEIAILSIGFYQLSLWLKQDQTKPLLSLFYGYCLLGIACKLLGLTTLLALVLYSGPIWAIFALLVHHDSLQRRLIMYRSRSNYTKATSSDWLEVIMRSGLIALNQKKEWGIIIEHHHELEAALIAPYIIKAPLQESLLTVIASSSCYQATAYLWIKNNGILHACNAQWNLVDAGQWHDQPVKDLAVWKQDALLMTLKTDAIVCRALPEARAFDIIIAGKIFEQISATQALTLMKKHLHYQPHAAQGGPVYEANTTSHSEQRSS